MTVQNGAEVFSESGLAGSKSVTVYKDLAGLVWSATLGHVDVSRGKNSYYKIQVSEGRSQAIICLSGK